MTVPTQTNKAIFTANGVTTEFPFTFGTLPTADLVVTLIDGDTETVVNPSDYTVRGAGRDDGGSVVFNDPPASGLTVLIQRLVPYTQPTDYKNQGSFYPRTHERSFDRATMQVQQLAEEVSRSFRLPAAVAGVDLELPHPVALSALVWNEDGTRLENGLPTIVGDMLLRPALASTEDGKGADMIGFRQGSSTAVARSLMRKIQEIEVSVRDFGAVGDGVNDDSDSVQKAVDYVATEGGGVLKFPVGTYLLNTSTGRSVIYSDMDGSISTITMNAALWVPAGVSLQFDLGAKILRTTGSLDTVVGLLDYAHASIFGIEIEGPGATGNVAHGILTCSTTGDHILRDITIQGAYIHHVGSYGIAVQFGHPDNLKIINVRISDVGADGIDHKVRHGGYEPQFGASRGCIIDGLLVERHGQRLYETSGLDFRGVGTLSNIVVRDFGRAGGILYGITLSAGISTGSNITQASARTTLQNFFVEAADPTMQTIGLHMFSCGPVNIGVGHIHWCNEGVFTRAATASPSSWLDGPSLTGVTVEGSRNASTGAFTFNTTGTRAVACRTLSDAQYFDAKRGNLEAGQTVFSPVGGVPEETPGHAVLKNGALLTQGTDYSISSGSVVMSSGVSSTDTIVIVAKTLRSVRVNAGALRCQVVAHYSDDYCLNGISVATAEAIQTGHFAVNREPGTQASPNLRWDGSVVQLYATGTLPNADLSLAPKGSGKLRFPLANVPEYADDTAAAAGGVPVGAMYRTGSALKVRSA